MAYLLTRLQRKPFHRNYFFDLAEVLVFDSRGHLGRLFPEDFNGEYGLVILAFSCTTVSAVCLFPSLPNHKSLGPLRLLAMDYRKE
jgi:hypothetical protein